MPRRRSSSRGWRIRQGSDAAGRTPGAMKRILLALAFLGAAMPASAAPPSEAPTAAAGRPALDASWAALRSPAQLSIVVRAALSDSATAVKAREPLEALLRSSGTPGTY